MGNTCGIVAVLGDTWYGHLVSNNSYGYAADIDTPTCQIRKGGAASDAAPLTYSPTVTVLSHASYSDGAYEVALEVTELNGFEVGEVYAVFVQGTIQGDPAGGIVGQFRVLASQTNPTAGEIADAVWDEAMGDHETADTTGATLAGIGSVPSAATVADAVLEELVATHATVNGSLAEYLAVAAFATKQTATTELLRIYRPDGISTFLTATIENGVRTPELA